MTRSTSHAHAADWTLICSSRLEQAWYHLSSSAARLQLIVIWWPCAGDRHADGHRHGVRLCAAVRGAADAGTVLPRLLLHPGEGSWLLCARRHIDLCAALPRVPWTAKEFVVIDSVTYSAKADTAVCPEIVPPSSCIHSSAAGPGEEQRLTSRHSSGRLSADRRWRLPASRCRLGLPGAAQPSWIHR